MNELFDYIIDWTRIGELLRSGRHKYTFVEFLPRVFIITLTLLPFFCNILLINKIFLSILFFVISHVIVIMPLIIKRLKMRAECYNIITLLKEKCICDDKILCYQCIEINKIMNNKASNGKSSATWGERKRLLMELLQ